MEKEQKLTAFEGIIKGYLDKIAETDEAFARTYAKPNKNIKECCKYIVSEAKKVKDGQVSVVEDATVYGWAMHYYDEDDIKIDDVPKVKVSTPTPRTTVKPTPKPEPEKPKERQLSIFDFL